MKNVFWAILVVLSMGCSPAESPASQTDAPAVGLPDVPSPRADGTQAHPQTIVVGTTFSGKVGSTSKSADKTSFYQFDSGSSTRVLLKIRATNPAQTNRTPYLAHLATTPAYGPDDFLSGAYGTENWLLGEEAAGVFSNLSPHRTYYFRVTNNQDNAAITYNLLVEPFSGSLNEGSDSVITLVPGATRASVTGKGSFTEPTASRYLFNTGTSTSVTLSFQLDTVGYEINAIAIGNFAGLKAEKFSRSGVTTRTLTGLAANTTYYLSTYSLLETDNQLRYDLNLTLN